MSQKEQTQRIQNVGSFANHCLFCIHKEINQIGVEATTKSSCHYLVLYH
jgi:hypothetical protein